MLIDQYVNELHRSTGLFPVVLPGSSIEVGDIIKFRKTNLFGKPKVGHFINVSGLKDLHVPFSVTTASTTGTSTYNSSSGVSVKTSAEIGQTIESEVSFQRKGLVYLSAIGVKELTIVNFRKVKDNLRPIIDKSLNDCFWVTKVILADSAVVMQSNEADGRLTFKTRFDPKLGLKLEAGAYEKQSYHNLLTDNVTLFVDLIRISVRSGNSARDEVITGIDVRNPQVVQFSGSQMLESKVLEMLVDEKMNIKAERKNKKLFFQVGNEFFEDIET